MGRLAISAIASIMSFAVKELPETERVPACPTSMLLVLTVLEDTMVCIAIIVAQPHVTQEENAVMDSMALEIV